MGKIKGWKKNSNNNYVWIGNLVSFPYAGSESRPELWIDNDDGTTYPFHNGWKVMVKTKSNYHRNYFFKSKKQALDYAINYMRSHPNG